ncbi:hypothetical protein ACFUJY_29310 [Streptomyces sp. NPDC057249]|uniref:hypothetical protein n=1 Tax=Streptomyces sp. NPDC057249 TaxID=3346067 RepID=UPI0036385084
MDYAYAVKNLPQPAADPAGGDPADPPPEEMQPPQEDDARPWAGDVYDEGDETDPAQAYAALSGPNGEQAWLDKAEDGTLTGWVRDETGQVWRYSDPDTWAIDVDDAGMQETGGTHGQPPAEGAGGQGAAVSDPGAGSPDDVEPLEFGTADEVVDPAGDAEAEADPATEADEDLDDGEGPDTADEDENEGDGSAKKKKGKAPWQ